MCAATCRQPQTWCFNMCRQQGGERTRAPIAPGLIAFSRLSTVRGSKICNGLMCSKNGVNVRAPRAHESCAIRGKGKNNPNLTRTMRAACTRDRLATSGMVRPYQSSACVVLLHMARGLTRTIAAWQSGKVLAPSNITLA